jgi:hypothetical protein
MSARRTLAAAAAAVFVLSAAGCSSPAAEPAPAPEPAPVAGTVTGNLITNTFTVVALDHTSRWATLRRPDGTQISFRVKETVRNLAEINVGDQVNVSYYESLAYEVKKPGEATPGTTYVGAAGRAPEGADPGGVMGHAVQMTATIVAIDQPNMQLTLKRPDGATVTTKVRDAEKLSRVQVGDLVEITYSEAMAIDVTKAPAAK